MVGPFRSGDVQFFPMVLQGDEILEVSSFQYISIICHLPCFFCVFFAAFLVGNTSIRSPDLSKSGDSQVQSCLMFTFFPVFQIYHDSSSIFSISTHSKLTRSFNPKKSNHKPWTSAGHPWLEESSPFSSCTEGQAEREKRCFLISTHQQSTGKTRERYLQLLWGVGITNFLLVIFFQEWSIDELINCNEV